MLRVTRTRRCTAGLVARAVGNPEVLGLYEILPRYPNFTTMGALRGLDYLGTCSFAVSGTVTAATCGCDLVGCVSIGAITALGGGTVRDCIFGQTPVSWIQEPEYIYMSTAWGLFVFFCCCCVQPDSYDAYRRIMFWSDTIGLGAFCVLGTMFAVRLGYSTFLVLVCTLVTCTGGGIIRDTLCRRPPRVLHAYAEMYAGTTVLGSALYLWMRKMKVPLHIRVPLGVLSVVAARCYCVSHQFALPTAIAVHRAHDDEVKHLSEEANQPNDSAASQEAKSQVEALENSMNAVPCKEPVDMPVFEVADLPSNKITTSIASTIQKVNDMVLPNTSQPQTA